MQEVAVTDGTDLAVAEEAGQAERPQLLLHYAGIVMRCAKQVLTATVAIAQTPPVDPRVVESGLRPRQQFVHVFGGSGGVPAFTVAPDGELSMTPGSEFGSDACVCVDAAMDPLGRFALLACHCGCDVQAYTIETNGALTQAPGSPYSDDDYCPNWILITDDSLVYVAAADTVFRHTAAADGTLSPVPGVAFPTRTASYIESMAFVDL